LGDRFFIRAVLHVPFSEAEGDFCWGVWAEVERPAFKRYVELYDQDASREPPFAGTLANALPSYDDTLELPVQIQFQIQTRRPSVRVLPNASSRLAVEQQNGIDNARYHEILNHIGGTR